MQIQISPRGGARMVAGFLLVVAIHLCTGTAMADEDKPRIILVVPPKRVDAPTQPFALPKSPPIRSEEELRTLALRIAENSELIGRFRSAVGSNDERVTARVMHEVQEYAQGLDPSASFSEGTRLALALMNLIGPAKDESNDRSAATEPAVADEGKSKPKIILGGHTNDASTRASTELPKPKPLKTQEELTPLASRVAENAALMQRLRAVIGSGDKSLGWDVMEEITRYAQSLDPSITPSDGTTIVLILMKTVSHPKGEIDG